MIEKNGPQPLWTVKNYRTVYLFAKISKILQEDVAQHLRLCLQRNRIMYSFTVHGNFQSGFGPHYSIDTTLVKILNYLYVASNQVRASLLLLLELSEVFDTTDHTNQCFTSGSGLIWVTINCLVNSGFSIHSKIKFRGPQDSVLGELLISLYMLPLGTIIHKHGISFNCYVPVRFSQI